MVVVSPVVTVTERLADRWSALRRDEIPDEVGVAARHCLLDWLGCALAGSHEPVTEVVVSSVVATEPPGDCTLVGRRERTPARLAALANGAAGHALDFDDTHTTMSGHPSVPVVPAVLALAEELDATGADVLTAIVVGIEVECRVGALLNPGHYRAGWHATGTVGTFGAAAACARLLGLDAERTAHALAVAATSAAGVKASFGTMAKPLHAGKAASDGLLAARLAAAGFVANPAVVEAPQGLAEAAAGGEVDLSRLDRFDDRWLTRETLFKFHAACYLTHASINAALALAGKVAADDIEAVEVKVAKDSLGVCAIPEPTTGLEGKFSLRATTAMALLGDDTADPAAYDDARMRSPELVALRDKVTLVPEADRVGTRSVVTVIARNGERFEADDDTGRPAADLALQGERLAAKFRALAAPVIGGERAETLHELVADVDTTSARELLSLMGETT